MCDGWVEMKRCPDVVVQFDDVENDGTAHMDDGFMTVSDCTCCLKANVKLFLHEDGTEIVGVNGGIVVSPLFRVDIPSSSQGIWFHAEMPRMDVDDKIES